MSSWSLQTVEADAEHVVEAAKSAYDEYKTRLGEGEGHVHAAIQSAIDGVQHLVDSGIFGRHNRVQVTMTGVANPAPVVAGESAPDSVTVHVASVPEPLSSAPVEEVKPEPEPSTPPMSEPHQDFVPPPGPDGAVQEPVGGRRGRKGKDEEVAE